jgi:hypothetical protein
MQLDEDLLGRIERVVLVAQHPPGRGHHLALAEHDQLIEGGAVARLGPLDEGAQGSAGPRVCRIGHPQAAC